MKTEYKLGILAILLILALTVASSVNKTPAEPIEQIPEDCIVGVVDLSQSFGYVVVRIKPECSNIIPEEASQ